MTKRRSNRGNAHRTASTKMSWAEIVLIYGPLAAEYIKYGYDYWRGRENKEQGNESSEEGNTREEEMRQREEELQRREEEMKQREEMMKQREEIQREEKLKKWHERKQKEAKMMDELNNYLKKEKTRMAIEAAAKMDPVSPPPSAAAEPSTVPPGGSGQQEHVPPPSPVRLPTLCQQYWTRTGCKKHACDQLHICKLLLAGICKFGAGCRNEHSLASDHNKTVCTAGGLFREPRITELRERFVEEGFNVRRFYLSQLEICRKQDGTCRNCIRIHICQQYVEGTCKEQEGCRFGHIVKTEHNIRVLHLHKAGDMNDLAILQLLSANTAPRRARAAPERAYATRRGARSAPRH